MRLRVDTMHVCVCVILCVCVWISPRSLAVDLRSKLGDWFRVVQLLKSGGGAGGCGFTVARWLIISPPLNEQVMTLC
jgi:hypothetical protein